MNHAYQILSDAAVKNRYDDLVGNFQAAEEKKETSSGFYESLLRKKSTEAPSDKKQAFDLDEELRKLERIK